MAIGKMGGMKMNMAKKMRDGKVGVKAPMKKPMAKMPKGACKYCGKKNCIC